MHFSYAPLILACKY